MSQGVHISGRAAGLTAYYFAGKLAEIRRRIAEGQDIINLGVGSPDLAPAEGVIGAVRRGAGEEDAFRYQPYRGIPALTAAMADHLRRDFGVEVPAEGIVPLLGSKEACGFLSLAHLDPGDAALVPDPGYPTYTSATRLAGGHRPRLRRGLADGGENRQQHIQHGHVVVRLLGPGREACHRQNERRGRENPSTSAGICR